MRGLLLGQLTRCFQLGFILVDQRVTKDLAFVWLQCCHDFLRIASTGYDEQRRRICPHFVCQIFHKRFFDTDFFEGSEHCSECRTGYSADQRNNRVENQQTHQRSGKSTAQPRWQRKMLRVVKIKRVNRRWLKDNE